MLIHEVHVGSEGFLARVRGDEHLANDTSSIRHAVKFSGFRLHILYVALDMVRPQM